MFAQLEPPSSLQTSIRIRSVPGNGLAGVTASQKHRLRANDDREAVRVYRTQPRTRLERARGKRSMQRNWMIVAAMAATVAACGPSTSQQPAASAAPKTGAAPTSDGVAPGDWPLINRTLAANRYSPLTDINAANVRNLETSWTFQLGGNSTAVPIVVAGVMYVPSRDRVVALDGDTGATIWTYVLPSSAPPPACAAPRPARPRSGRRRSHRLDSRRELLAGRRHARSANLVHEPCEPHRARCRDR